MSKSLQEIQEFNLKKIICAVNGTENYEEALDKEYFKYGGNRLEELMGKNLTLDRVLLALKNLNKIFIYFDIGNSDICEREPECGDYDYFRVLANWGLTKRTLEEQSEETQRAIYELLGGEND